MRFGIDLHLELLEAIAPDDDVRDAGNAIRRNLRFQYAIIDRSVRSSVLEVTPIFMTRLVADNG